MTAPRPAPEASDGTVHLVVDLAANVLRFTFGSGEAPTEGSPRRLAALLDVGEGGRLLGFEINDPGRPEPEYVELDPPTGGHVRSVAVLILAWSDPATGLRRVDIPRRGEGYEITYPSGNQ